MSAPTVLAYIPSPPQGVWHLGPVPVRAYALFIIVGIIVAVWWGSRRWRARGGQHGEVLDVAIWAVPFGLVGGRLYHLMTDWPTYFGADAEKTPLDALKIWEGGLGIWGAVAFGALGAWFGCRHYGIKLGPFGDAIAPAILLAQAIGRLGNYFNQELFGRTTSLPWGLEIFDRRNAYGQVGPNVIDGVSTGHVAAGLTPAVHPTFLYELLWNLIVVVILVLLDRYARIGHGRLFALYVAGYCIGRFGVELMRSDHASLIAGIRVNVFTAAIVFACAAAYFVLATKGRELGLTMYRPWRAAELEEAGAVGYVDPYARDDDAEDADAAGATPGASMSDDDADETPTDDTESGAVPVEPETEPATDADPEAGASQESAVGAVGAAESDTDSETDTDRVVRAAGEIAAPASVIFELIADPAQQPRWDGNGNLDTAAAGQRVHKVGDVFETTTTKGHVRRNQVVEFIEGRLIAWLPSEPDAAPPGHLWRWELTEVDEPNSPRTRVTHTYDWTRLSDPARYERARWTTADKLQSSLDRLAELAESQVRTPNVVKRSDAKSSEPKRPDAPVTE